MLSRRGFSGLLAGVSLFGGTPVHAETGALAEAARKEGGVTWYTAQTDGETAERIGRQFTARFPGVKVTVVRTTAQVAYERLLARYVPQNDAALSKKFQAFDKDGYYHTTSGGLVLIARNANLVSTDDAPTNWPDLLDPKWNRKLTVGHPAFSGFVGTWVVAMRKLYGWQYFEAMEKNRPQVGRSIIDTTTTLTAGERSIGASSATSTLHALDKGNPLAVIYPTDGTLLIVAASAILPARRIPTPQGCSWNFCKARKSLMSRSSNVPGHCGPQSSPCPAPNRSPRSVPSNLPSPRR